MISAPKISVIMPVYNSGDYLRDSIQSILDQTFTDFEFIIVNDKSADDSLKIIKSFLDPRIILLNNITNIGITKSLNKALKKASGKYIARMDADDISLPQRFEVQVNFLDQNPKIGVVGSWIKVFGRHNEVWKYFTDPDVLKVNQLFNGSMVHPSVMMRKSYLEKYHLKYNEDFPNAQDYELWSRCVNYFKIANIGKALLMYRLHGMQSGVKNSTTREILIEKIRRRELKRIGLKFTEEEFIVHNQIAFKKYPDNLQFLSSAEMWLKKIYNHKPSKAMGVVLENYWFLVCLHFKAWRCYILSPLSRQSNNFIKHLMLITVAFLNGKIKA